MEHDPRVATSDLLSLLTPLAPFEGILAPAPTCEVSVVIPARDCAAELSGTVTLLLDWWSRERNAGGFEVVLAVDPAPGDTRDPTPEVAAQLARENAQVLVVRRGTRSGKGAALRDGVAAAGGKTIYLVDADLPYGTDALSEIRLLLANGADFVAANRRLPGSRIEIPEQLERIAARRRATSLWFNRAVHLLLPISSLDTQAGMKAMQRSLAQAAFARITCPGFFFDLELFLVAARHSARTSEIPVTQRLSSESSTVRLVREAALASVWLPRIARNLAAGRYEP
jgi:glycosyltransferase involved in cell wall biosynthesis